MHVGALYLHFKSLDTTLRYGNERRYGGISFQRRLLRRREAAYVLTVIQANPSDPWNMFVEANASATPASSKIWTLRHLKSYIAVPGASIQNGSALYLYTEIEAVRGRPLLDANMFQRVAFASFYNYRVCAMRVDDCVHYYKITSDSGGNVTVCDLWEIKTNLLVHNSVHKVARCVQ